MTIALNRNNSLRSRWRRRFTSWVRGPTFARDIAIILAIKFALLIVLKYSFFNHPQAEHMSLPPEQVSQALLSAPASHPSQGDQHAR
ncbi:cytochrome oxidase putative small subunit CydP [Paraburkholderia sp. RL18-085-BIA-A]|uniref:cytochrome oxidase putative small subunit CydP n=1 Tax=Paraburkholderia sp. RL18-085-BIA-A TaxID=3031633 RepID=UPI0038BA0A3C